MELWWNRKDCGRLPQYSELTGYQPSQLLAEIFGELIFCHIIFPNSTVCLQRISESYRIN